MLESKSSALPFGYNSRIKFNNVEEVGFEPTKEFSNRFTVYHLWPLGHSSKDLI